MLQTYEQKSGTKLAAMLATIIVIAGVVLLSDHIKAQSNISPSTNIAATQSVSSTTTPTSTTSSDTTTAPTTDTPTTPSTNTSGYADGTYSASSDYYVPNGTEEIQVNVTLKSGVISAVSIKNSESNPDSASYQEYFAAEYKNYVVGRKISGLQISTLSGASDTTQGFNDALNQIASKAQA